MAERIIGRLTYKIVGDDREFEKALRRSVRNLDKTADRLQQIGGRLTTFATAPILAAGGAALKAASDLEESLNAVNVVFGDSAAQITEWGENAANQAGLAQAEFNQAAVRLGASLKNAGVPLDEVAGSTINLTQRAADLASVFNTDVNDALGAIASALRGEADPIERFGATVNAAAVEAKALELGLAATRSEITEQIKVQARLAVIMEQTAGVAGDFANTADSAANATRITKAEVIDLAAELGEELLPIAQAVISQVLKLVREFEELDQTQKQNIIRIAAVAAAMGPLVAGVGTAIKAVNGLRLAFIALSANPIILAVAGLTAGVVALGAALREASAKQQAEDMERYAEAAEEAGVSVTQMANDHRLAQTALKQQLQYGTDLETAIRNIADDYSVTRSQAIELARDLGRYVEGQEDVLDALEAQVQQQEESKGLGEQQVDVYEDQLELMTAINESQQSAADAAENRAAAERAALEAQREARSEAWAETLTEYYQTQQGQLELLTRELEAYQEALDNPDSDLGVRTERGRQVVRAIISDLEEEIERRRQALGLLDDSNESLAEHSRRQGETSRNTEEMTDSAEDLTEALTGVAAVWAKIEEDAEDTTDLLMDSARAIQQGWADAFTALGVGFEQGIEGAELFKEAMKGVAITVLRALGEELAVRAAAAFAASLIPGNQAQLGTAAAYGAASAAAYTAAGTISAFGQGGAFYADQPQAIVVGDRPEFVDIRPVDHAAPPGWAPGGGGITIQGDVYGYEDFARKVEQAQARSGRLGRTGR